MENHKESLRRQVSGGSEPVDFRSSELEAWSTPVLIGLNAAAGTEAGSIGPAVENVEYDTTSLG